jgi:hypothetical protein
MREAWTDSRMARGYLWDEARNEFQLLSTEALNVDALAPAGAISSTVLDMASSGGSANLLPAEIARGQPVAMQ